MRVTSSRAFCSDVSRDSGPTSAPSGRPEYYFQFHGTTFQFGSRAFRISAPKLWNYLPLTFCSVKYSPHLDVILKTHFQSVYPAAYSTHPNAPWFSSETLALYKSFTWLLTYLDLQTAVNWSRPSRPTTLSRRLKPIGLSQWLLDSAAFRLPENLLGVDQRAFVFTFSEVTSSERRIVGEFLHKEYR